MDPRTPEVIAELEKLGLQSCHLDSAVHDAASEMASAVNNEGMKEQVEFLLKTNTWKPADIIFAAQQTAEPPAAEEDETECTACNDGSCPWCVEERTQKARP